MRATLLCRFQATASRGACQARNLVRLLPLVPVFGYPRLSMKNEWSVYVIAAAISALAGVAIAGLPRAVASEPTIITPAVTAAPTSTIAPVDVIATSTEAAPTEPAQTSTTAVEQTTTTIVTAPAVERADVVVVAVNGAGVAGLAARTSDQLLVLGYDKVRATDGDTLVEETKVYFFDGFESEAQQVSIDLDLDPALAEPVILAPSFGTIDGDQVTVYLGRDSF